MSEKFILVRTVFTGQGTHVGIYSKSKDDDRKKFAQSFEGAAFDTIYFGSIQEILQSDKRFFFYDDKILIHEDDDNHLRYFAHVDLL